MCQLAKNESVSVSCYSVSFIKQILTNFVNKFMNTSLHQQHGLETFHRYWLYSSFSFSVLMGSDTGMQQCPLMRIKSAKRSCDGRKGRKGDHELQ